MLTLVLALQVALALPAGVAGAPVRTLQARLLLQEDAPPGALAPPLAPPRKAWAGQILLGALLHEAGMVAAVLLMAGMTPKRQGSCEAFCLSISREGATVGGLVYFLGAPALAMLGAVAAGPPDPRGLRGAWFGATLGGIAGSVLSLVLTATAPTLILSVFILPPLAAALAATAALDYDAPAGLQERPAAPPEPLPQAPPVYPSRVGPVVQVLVLRW